MPSSTIKLKNYRDSSWVPSSNNDYLEVVNPATSQVISEVPLSTSSDVEETVQSARKAFSNWRRTPVTERIQYLFQLKELLEENIDPIARTITEECGKTIRESRGELRRAIENVEVACGAPSLMQGYNNEDIASGIDETMIRQPIGIAAIICPFNFPAMIPFWFMPYALATGNSCVIKPSERVPNTMNILFELIDQLELPEGVVNMIHGDHKIANQLIEHPDVASISFVDQRQLLKRFMKKRPGTVNEFRLQAVQKIH